MTMKQKEELKTKVIEDLYSSGEIQQKIEYICYKHFIPKDSFINEDILQVVMENLWKYDTNKFIDAYLDNPNRILGLAVTLALRKGVYKDERTSKFWNQSIAQQILHQSTLNTYQHIDTTQDNTNDYNIIQISTDDNETMEFERNNEMMWSYVKVNLTQYENNILNIALTMNSPKMKGKIKKDYIKLLPKLKSIIIEFKKMQNG